MGNNVNLVNKNKKKSECYISTAEILRPKKKVKKELTSTTLGYLWSRKGSRKAKDLKRLKILFDTGCSGTIVNRSVVKKLAKKNCSTTKWSTKTGSLKTNRKCKIKIILPEFHPNREIEWSAYVDDNSSLQSRYDLIIGRDMLNELGIDFLFSTGQMCWDNATVYMRSPDSFDNIDSLEEEILLAQEELNFDADRIQEIIDSKYSPQDLDAVVADCKHLTEGQRKELRKLLEKYKSLFDGSLGTWKTEPIELELKDPHAKPYHARPYPVPKINERKLREEVERLVKFGVLRKINRSEWACPMFTINKPDGTLRSLADLRELNKRIVRKPFPLPKISDMLLGLEGFQWATSLDLNMGFYHLILTPNSSRLCTIVLPWGKYEYLRLPMGLCNSPDIFQEKINELIDGLEFARAYIDDLLVISK